MPINRNSRMRQHRKAVHGWKEGEKFFLSLHPKGSCRVDKSARPANGYASAQEALSEASRRSVAIVWHDSKEIQ